MKKRSSFSVKHILLAAVLVAINQPGQTADLDTGQKKAQACVVCHGRYGISVTPDAPHLAGQPALYLEAQLRAFKEGQRMHQVMNVIAQQLNDEDIGALAAWFASIEIEAKPPTQ